MNPVYESIRQDSILWENFTRKEEYYPEKLDKHQRFSHKLSKFKDISFPEVSRALIESGFCPQYPDNKEFALCLTHDIDDIYPPLSHTAYSTLCCIKGLDITGLKDQLHWRIKGRKYSPYLNLKEIMSLEEKYGAKSSFYFMATEKDIRRFRYCIEDSDLELGYIIDNGWEVGLHGGYFAYMSLDEIVKEKKRLERKLGKEILGYRNHYLRMRIPNTWESLARAGFKYDCTLGYSDMVGFRNGLCHPFWPYNLAENRYINILELNLNIMDDTLFNKGTSLESSWSNAKYLIDIARQYHGVLTLLWHNSSFDCPFRKDRAAIYERILKYGKELGAWMTSGIEICSHWNQSMR